MHTKNYSFVDMSVYITPVIVCCQKLKPLENAGYVKQRKGSANGRKLITVLGKEAFSNHIQALIHSLLLMVVVMVFKASMAFAI